jgi:oligopeptide transport system substrate-binding protein
MHRKSLVNAISAIATMTLVCLSANASTSSSTRKIILHLPHEPATLDWNVSARRIDQLVILNLHEGLIEVSASHQPQAVLAKSWKISPDGMTYTFILRQDVKWSDGKPLVAQHFVDSWKRLLTPMTSTGNGYFLLAVVGAENFFRGKETDFAQVGIKALNDYTIQIRLRKPLWNWIWNFAQPATFPIRQDMINRHGAKFWTAPGNLVTVGPYTLASHDLDSLFVLKKNPLYNGHTGNITEVDFKIIPDSQAITAFTQGKMDLLCYLSGADDFPLEATQSLRWVLANTTKRLDFNVKRFPFNDRKVREAVALAIDRKKLVEQLGARMSSAGTLAPPSMATYSTHSEYSYEPVQAKRTLRGAFVDNLSLEILVPLFDEHASENLNAAEMIAQMLRDILGATVTIQKAETEQLYSLLRDTKDYSLLIRDITGTNDPDEFYAFYASETKKSTSWSNPDYDKLIEQSRAEKDPGKRMELYRKMEKLLVSGDYAVLPLFYESDATLVGPRVLGFEKSIMQPCRVRDLSVK